MRARYLVRGVIAVSVGAWCVAASAPAGEPVTFMPLGEATRASGISTDGSTVVGNMGHDGNPSHWRAVRWRGGIMTPLNPFGGGNCSTSHAASSNGDVVVGNAFNGDFGLPDTVPYRWEFGMSSAPAGQITGGCGELFGAHGVSDDGSAVVGDAGFTRRAFRWTASDFKDIGPLDSFSSSARGVSGGGTTAAGWAEAFPGSNREAFRWTPTGGPVLMGFLPGETTSAAEAVSLDGLTIAGASGAQAFRWTLAEGMMVIAGMESALAVSGDGSLIAGIGGGEAAVWTAGGGTQSLFELLLAGGAPVSGWSLLDITGVSADGLTLAGNGLDPMGQPQGFIATIPAPAGAATLLAGLGALAGRWRRS